MTAVQTGTGRSESPATAVAGLGGVVLALALGLVAHGCHGADVDHEPGVAGPRDRRQPDAEHGR